MTPFQSIRRRLLIASACSTAFAWLRPRATYASLKDASKIDCQSHLFCPALLQLMEKRKGDPIVYKQDGLMFLRMGDWLRKVPPLYWDVDAKLAVMDEAGIEMTALSINDPGPEWFGDSGLEVALIANDFVAGIVNKYPSRFFGLCVLPWQDIQASLDELDRCKNKLGMRGVLVYTNLVGRFVDEEEYRPILEKAADLDLPILLHPAKPVTTDFVKTYEMTSFLGNMFDNTIALTRLIMSGTLDRIPKLKVVCPHLGGTLPYIVGRLDHQVNVLKRGPKNLERTPSEYLHQVWLDIVSPLPLAMKYGLEFMGSDRLLYASDHPWVEPKLILDHLARVPMTVEDRDNILSQNARLLFKLDNPGPPS